MANGGSGFLDLFLRQSDRHTDLQRRRDDLFRLKVILKRLQPGNEDAIRKALYNQLATIQPVKRRTKPTSSTTS